MVSYFSRRHPVGHARRATPRASTRTTPCGKTIAVQNSTVQETDDLPARQKKCGANKIKILPFERPGPGHRRGRHRQGRRHARRLARSPRTRSSSRAASSQPLGDIYEAAPYGYVLPKDETDFADAIAEALKEIKADGSYKAALEKWGVEQGAISDFAVNPMTRPTTSSSGGRSARSGPGSSDADAGSSSLALGGHRRHRRAGVDVPATWFFNPAFNWPFVFQAMNQNPVIEGFWKGTILVTDPVDDLRRGLGVVLAVMRLSDNPVLGASPGSTPGSSGPSRATCC